jgi:hypothetical protein
MGMLVKQYGLERRWPGETFWSRRHQIFSTKSRFSNHP